MRRTLGWLLIAHLILSVALFATMDTGFSNGTLSNIHNALIDGYEAIGFGVFPVGIAVVTAILGAAWFWLKRDTVSAND